MRFPSAYLAMTREPVARPAEAVSSSSERRMIDLPAIHRGLFALVLRNDLAT